MNKFFYILAFVLIFGFNSSKAQNYTTHKVKEGETVESIAKRYYVAPFNIYALNPDAKKELKINSILIVPRTKTLSEPKVTIIRELTGFEKHKTKRKETLYSLSKKYNVTQEELKKANTFLYAKPLRRGDRLKIPIFKTTEIVETIETTKPYIVLPKEGKWRIAYKFKITVKELEALNPNMAHVLQEGEQIQVPNIEKADQKAVDDTYSYYKVLPKEGFYRLKIKLGLEQETLEILNPGLKESGLKEGMVLKVPFSNTIEGYGENKPTRVDLTQSIKDFNTKHIVIMLPFRLNRISFDSITETKKQISKDPYLKVSLDFHSGVLMAIDSLKKLGVSLKVDVYDTRNQVSEVIRIINENDFEDVDAVIGPLTSNNFEKAALGLRPYNVPLVSPIGANLNLYNNVFQSKPSVELLKNKILNFVKADSLASQIIIVSDSKSRTVANSIKQEFSRAVQIYSRKDKKGIDQNYLKIEDIKSVLKPGKNIVFLETQNDGFASNVTSILNSLIQEENKEEKLKKIDIVLVTTNINDAFEKGEIDNNHLSNLQFHFATTSKLYTENDNYSFVKRYKQIYSTTPNKPAVRGFDLTMDVVLRLVTSKNLYMSVNEAQLTEYIENKFTYKRKLLGGYYNDAVYLVKHKDLEIVEVK